MVTGCALRFAGLGRFSFDGDEIFSIRAVQGSWAHLFRMVVGDISHPPLFYMLLKLWLGLGPPSETWVRLLPAIFGALALLPLYGICRALRLRVADQMLVCGLFAVNGSLIYFSQHARMFSLLVATSVLSLYVLVRYLQTAAPGARWTAALIGVNIPLVYSHYWGWLVLLAEGVVLLLFRRDRLWRFLHAMIGVAIAFLPWAIAVTIVILHRGSVASQIRWITEPGGKGVFWFLGDITGAPNFPHATLLGEGLFALPIVLLVARLMRDARFREEFEIPPFAWLVLFILPIVVTLLPGYVTSQSVWGERQLLIVFAPFYVLVGIAVARLPWPRLVMAAQAVLLLWSTAAGLAMVTDPLQKLQWGALAQFILRDSPPGPAIPIYAAEKFVSWPLSFYLDRIGGASGRLVLAADPNTIAGQRFWFVYRNITWPDRESAEAMFKARGFVVVKRDTTTTHTQSITALLLRRGG